MDSARPPARVPDTPPRPDADAPVLPLRTRACGAGGTCCGSCRAAAPAAPAPPTPPAR